ncbi:hypothetical protein ACWGIV_34225 [Streptomyces sp. NPDC054844]
MGISGGQLRRGVSDVQLLEFPVHEEDLGGGPALASEERVPASRTAP